MTTQQGSARLHAGAALLHNGEVSMEQKQFTLGDRVFWSSRGGNKTSVKTGRVVAVVPANQTPHSRLFEHELSLALERYCPGSPRSLTTNFDGFTRTHESYLVAVIRDGRAHLYWPRVALLELDIPPVHVKHTSI